MNDSPLAGLRIAVTRPDPGADELAAMLSDSGATAVRLPLTRVTGPADPAPLRRALERLASYDWIVFTSSNGARFLARALHMMPAPAPVPRARIVTVGAATRAAVTAELGWRVDVEPAEQRGAAIVPAMSATAALRGRRVLWPRARAARPTIRRDLAAAGAILDDPETYGTEAVPEAAAELAQRLTRRELDAIILTSPSGVAALAAAHPDVGACIVAVIGPTTAAAARSAGLPVHVEPESHTIPALVNGLVRFVARSRQQP
ncbi:MAG TPA: uroporphyrinogen-III synthase [Longimicrobiales bacterium]|nr:uroporphyrinogen-III synthase [Longimicrobiales bacterium]